MTNDPIKEKLPEDREIPLDDLSKVAGAGEPFDIYCWNCRSYNHFGNLDPNWKEVTCMKCGALITRR